MRVRVAPDPGRSQHGSCQVEDTERLPESEAGARRVRIKKAAKPGQDIRTIGSDIM